MKGNELHMTRRTVLGAAAGAAALVAGAGAVRGGAEQPEAKPVSKPKESKGRIKQSIVHWCFQDHWDVEKTCRVAKDLGCLSVEIVGPEHWPTLKRHGLTCAIAPSHGFVRGMNNPKYWDECLAILRQRIDESAEFGCPSVITFTGMREDIPDDVGIENCVKGFKKVIGHAEKKKVDLCLEMLNSRVGDHPMKGHPGYQGDHTDY